MRVGHADIDADVDTVGLVRIIVEHMDMYS